MKQMKYIPCDCSKENTVFQFGMSFLCIFVKKRT